MKIKKDLNIATGDFWYDLTKGGYLKPEEMLVYVEDIKKVKDAIKVIEDFEDSCEEQFDLDVDKHRLDELEQFIKKLK